MSSQKNAKTAYCSVKASLVCKIHTAALPGIWWGRQRIGLMGDAALRLRTTGPSSLMLRLALDRAEGFDVL